MTSVLYYAGWSGWGLSDEAWFVIMLVVATVVAAVMAWTRADIAYLLVLAWAFAGIGIKHAGTGTVSTAAWMAAAMVLLLSVVSAIRRWQAPTTGADA